MPKDHYPWLFRGTIYQFAGVVSISLLVFPVMVWCFVVGFHSILSWEWFIATAGGDVGGVCVVREGVILATVSIARAVLVTHSSSH